MSPFAFRAEDVFRIVRRGVCFQGTVLSGAISEGARLVFEHRGTQVTGTVVGIAHGRTMVRETTAGPNIAILLKGLTDSELERSLHPTAEEMEGPEPPLEIPCPQVLRLA